MQVVVVVVVEPVDVAAPTAVVVVAAVVVVGPISVDGVVVAAAGATVAAGVGVAVVAGTVAVAVVVVATLRIVRRPPFARPVPAPLVPHVEWPIREDPWRPPLGPIPGPWYPSAIAGPNKWRDRGPVWRRPIK